MVSTARIYTDCTKTTPIGNQFSLSTAWQRLDIQGITANSILTDTIYYNKTSGYGAIGEIVINADKFLF